MSVMITDVSYRVIGLQPLNSEQYDSIRRMASEIHAQAPDARILTTYYCGKCFFFLNHYNHVSSCFRFLFLCFSLCCTWWTSHLLISCCY